MTVVIEPSIQTTVWSAGVVHPSDRERLHQMFAECSPETVVRRFFGRVLELPKRYLDQALGGDAAAHDAVVARYGDGLRIAGLASLAGPSDAGPDVPELGVLVPDAWQRRRVGSALVNLLVLRARERGVERIAASVLPGRSRLLQVLARQLPIEQMTIGDDVVMGVFAL
ncbi:MAG TPA: GNAT family N-acetyltransferase [Jatrophihabitans sp.]|nr:GNAT family N-acetyltransferase [Jatrophihabitans sp.]